MRLSTEQRTGAQFFLLIAASAAGRVTGALEVTHHHTVDTFVPRFNAGNGLIEQFDSGYSCVLMARTAKLNKQCLTMRQRQFDGWASTLQRPCPTPPVAVT